jgi:hypothetical protein
MCFYYDGYNEFSWSRELHARKRHHCEECGSAPGVRVGEMYERTTGKWEGEIFSLATCARCVALRKLVHEYELARGCDWTESWCPSGELQAALGDYRNEDGAWAEDDETWVSVWPDELPADVAAVHALGEALRARHPVLLWTEEAREAAAAAERRKRPGAEAQVPA